MGLILRSSWETAPESKPLNVLSEARRAFSGPGRELSTLLTLRLQLITNNSTSNLIILGEKHCASRAFGSFALSHVFPRPSGTFRGERVYDCPAYTLGGADAHHGDRESGDLNPASKPNAIQLPYSNLILVRY
jgi:hypothetical protein